VVVAKGKTDSSSDNSVGQSFLTFNPLEAKVGHFVSTYLHSSPKHLQNKNSNISPKLPAK